MSYFEAAIFQGFKSHMHLVATVLETQLQPIHRTENQKEQRVIPVGKRTRDITRQLIKEETQKLTASEEMLQCISHRGS